MVSGGLRLFSGASRGPLAAVAGAGRRATAAAPELVSISTTAQAVDRSTLPAIERFQARDGTVLGYRHYPARRLRPRRSPSWCTARRVRAAVHALAGLGGAGVETYALDIRGHGVSGTRGDIAYLGQLEDDLADFVAMVRKTSPAAPLTLIGHSAGGGFALRVAGSPIQNLFRAPCCWRPISATTRRATAEFRRLGQRRYSALHRAAVLRRIGIVCCDRCRRWPSRCAGLKAVLASTYAYRLMRNFATHPDYRGDLAAATNPIAIFAGAADELMFPDKYRAVG